MAAKTVRVEITGDPSSFERSMTVVSESASRATSNVEEHAHRVGGAFSKLDNVLGGFGLPFTGALSEIGNKIDEFSVKGQSNFEKLSRAGGLALGGLAVAAAGIALESIHLADKFEESHARLETAVKDSGGSFEDYSGKIDGANKKLESLGFTNTETEGALARLVTGTGDVTKSVQLMGLAADIARARHISLEAATDILVKVEAGRYTVLGRTLGVSKEVVAGLHSTDDAVRLLSDRFGGAAQKNTETFQGKLQVLEAKSTDVGIKIGMFLIPIIEKLVGAIADTIDWFEKHEAAAIAVAAVITGVLGAAITAFVVNKVASFVEGIQTMLTHLGLLGAKAEATAAVVSASGAESAAGGAAAGGGAAGAGAAGALGGVAEGEAAVGTGAATAGGSLMGLVLPLALVAGAAYGLSTAFKASSVNIDLNVQKLEGMSAGALSRSISKLVEYGGKIGDSEAANKAFNAVLDEAPQYAQRFIDAASKAGINTDGFSTKLREHVAAAEMARNAQQRWALQTEIADAKARGDAAAVYGLTLQLNAIPTDKQIQIILHHQQAYADLLDFRRVWDGLYDKEIRLNVIEGDVRASTSPSSPIFAPFG